MRSPHSIVTRIRQSLRAKVGLGVVLPLVTILGIFTILEHNRHRAVALNNLSLLATQTGQVIESNLRHQMLVSDFSGVQESLDAIANTGNFRAIYLLDTTGRVIFAPNLDGVGERLDPDHPTCQPCHSHPPDERPGSVVVTATDGQRVFRSMQPIENGSDCAPCHGKEERLIGVLLTDISMAPLEEPLAADLREHLLWWAGIILVTVLIVSQAINRLVIRRLEGFSSAIADLGEGHLPNPLPEGQADEIGRLAGAFNIMAKRVEARDQENLALSERLRQQSAQRGKLLKSLITAQEDERKRVARELHDELGQSLGGLALRAEAMRGLINSGKDRALTQLDTVQELIKESTDRMYELILALRPSSLDDLGLAPALRAHAERALENTDTQLEFDAQKLTHRLPAEIETAVFRTFQEALNNTVRHADASRVHVTLACQNGLFVGEVQDDGRGFDLEAIKELKDNTRGLGLLGMQERVALCGGRLEISSRPGKGTRIQVRIPLTESGDG